MPPKKPKGFLVRALGILVSLLETNPRWAVAFSTILSAAVFSMFTSVTQNISAARKREAVRMERDEKMDSAMVLAGKIFTIVHRLDSTQSPDHDTLRVLNGAVNRMKGGRAAKARFRQEERDAKAVLGITSSPAPAEHTDVELPKSIAQGKPSRAERNQ